MKNQGMLEGTVADILDSAPTELSDYNEVIEKPTIKKPVKKNKSVIPRVRNIDTDDFELPSIYKNLRNDMMTKIIQKDNIMEKVNSSNTKIKIKKPTFMVA